MKIASFFSILFLSTASLSAEISIADELEVPSGETKEITVDIPEEGSYILGFSAYKPVEKTSGYTGLFKIYVNDRELLETVSRPNTFRIQDGRDILVKNRFGWAVPMTPDVEIFRSATQNSYQSKDPDFDPLLFRFPVRKLPSGPITLQFKNNQESGTENTLMVRNLIMTPDTSANPDDNHIEPASSAEIEIQKSGSDADRPVRIQLWRPSSHIAGSQNIARIYFNDEEIIDATNRSEGWIEDADRTLPAYLPNKGWRVPFAPSPEAYANSQNMPGYIEPDIFDKMHLELLIPNKDGTLRIENTSKDQTLTYRLPGEASS